MKTVINKTKNIFIAENIVYADTLWQRLIGLMFKRSSSNIQGMLFSKAPFIHTCFMFMPIDIIFLDKQKKVIKINKNVRPWRLASCKESSFTLELPSSLNQAERLTISDQLEF